MPNHIQRLRDILQGKKYKHVTVVIHGLELDESYMYLTKEQLQSYLHCIRRANFIVLLRRS